MCSIPRPFVLALLERRLAEPLLEPDVAQPRLAGGNQRAFAEFCPEVSRVLVDDNLAGIVASGEALADQFVETELLRTGDVNGAVHWGAHGDPADRRGDVVSGHRLNEYGWQPNGRSDRGFIGNAFDEL